MTAIRYGTAARHAAPALPPAPRHRTPFPVTHPEGTPCR